MSMALVAITEVAITRAARDHFPKDAVADALRRFEAQDYGEVAGRAPGFDPESPWRMGVYRVNGEPLWIVHDGTLTTIMRPEDY